MRTGALVAILGLTLAATPAGAWLATIDGGARERSSSTRAATSLCIIGTYRPVDVIVHQHRVRTLAQELHAQGIAAMVLLR